MSASTPAPVAKRFPWWIYWLTLLVVLAVTFAPMASAYYAEGLAQANGCRLTDGGTDGACADAQGNDLRPLIGNLMLFAWMLILIMPLGFVLGLVWLIVLIVHRILWGRARQQGGI